MIIVALSYTESNCWDHGISFHGGAGGIGAQGILRMRKGRNSTQRTCASNSFISSQEVIFTLLHFQYMIILLHLQILFLFAFMQE